MPPLDDLTSIRALVEFQYLRSDLLAEHRAFQGAIVARRLACSRGSKRGWLETIEDVTQEAQSKLSRKLHQADEWRASSQTIAARCAVDAAIEWFRREDHRPEIEEDSDVAQLTSPAAADPETFWDSARCAVGKATSLASSAGASLRDAKLWAGAEIVGRSPAQLAEQFNMQPNAIYQARHRVRQKVLSHLQGELRLSADEYAVLENEMRSRDRQSHAQRAMELSMTATEVTRISRALRTRVADYLDAMEER